MGYRDEPPSYEELLRDFKDALDRVLSGAALPPSSAMADMTLTLALLAVSRAVRENHPPQPWVTRACAAFAQYAANEEALSRA